MPSSAPPDEPAGWRRRAARSRGAAARALARVNHSASLQVAARLARERLPGDSGFGDPLSTTGDTPTQAVIRRLTDATHRRPGVLRELGLSALQVWQHASEAQGRGRGDTELTIVFTDLEGFSDFALRAGDDAAVELLRRVGRVTEPPMADAGGTVVKRLGDGVMATFRDPAAALQAVHLARAGVEALTAGDYRPRLRAGVHLGRPRRLAGDLFGVDVNVAARLAEAAGGGEVLVSGVVARDVRCEAFRFRRRRRFRVKGVPEELDAYRLVEP